MEVHRYLGGRLPVLVAGILGIALAVSAAPASAANRGGGTDYLLLSPTLTIDDVILNEGTPSGTTVFTFTIALSKPAAVPVCVDVYTVDGTATVVGSDYQPISATICIPANTTTYTVDVLVNKDTTDEPNEYFYVKLANVTGGGSSIGDDSGTGLILNDDGGTPTLLQTFDAASTEDGITLRWQFANAAEVASSFLERSAVRSDSWARVDADVRSEGELLVLTDRNIESEGTYQYRLTAQMKNGQTMRFGPIVATAGVITKEFALDRVSPTPTRGPATIDFAVPHAANVKISILDVQGRVIDVLVDGMVSSGRHSVTWNAASRSASRAGIYFARMDIPGGKYFVKRVVVTE